MYGLLHVEMLWLKKFGTELEGRFERSRADSCGFRWVLRGKVVIILVYVDNVLVASTTKRDEEQTLRDFYSCFSIKALGEPPFFLGYHITRDRNAGTLEFGQHRFVQVVAEGFEVNKTSAIPTVAGGKALSQADSPKTDTEGDGCCRSPTGKPSGL